MMKWPFTNIKRITKSLIGQQLVNLIGRHVLIASVPQRFSNELINNNSSLILLENGLHLNLMCMLYHLLLFLFSYPFYCGPVTDPLSVCLSVFLSVCLSVCLSVYLSVCLPFCLSVGVLVP